MDSFYNSDSYPLEGDFSHARFSGKNAGGCCLNVAAVCKSKDVNVKVLDMLPSNTNGLFLLDTMNKLNLDTSNVIIDNDVTTGEVIIINTNDKRTMFVIDPVRKYYEINKQISKLLNNATYIYSMMHVLNRSFKDLNLLLDAKKQGAKVILDACSKYDDPSRIKILYDLADGIFINETDYARLKAVSKTDPIETILNKGEFVLITNGSIGSTLYTKNKIYKEETVKNVKVIDSTGAGDSFAGAFLASLIKGYDYSKALKLATVSGAFACTGLSGLAGVTSEDNLINFAKEHNYDL